MQGNEGVALAETDRVRPLRDVAILRADGVRVCAACGVPGSEERLSGCYCVTCGQAGWRHGWRPCGLPYRRRDIGRDCAHPEAACVELRALLAQIGDRSAERADRERALRRYGALVGRLGRSQRQGVRVNMSRPRDARTVRVDLRLTPEEFARLGRAVDRRSTTVALWVAELVRAHLTREAAP